MGVNLNKCINNSGGGKGFITIATGNEWYRIIAYYLFLSYRVNTSNPLPFAVITDKSDNYSKAFDYEIIIDDAKCNYLDKLLIEKYSPFNETVFLDSDILAYSDLNLLFDIFGSSSDFSCMGNIGAIEEDCGWFRYNDLPYEYQKRVTYIVGLHGGIYYFRKSSISHSVISDALKIIDNYSDFNFKIFKTPADEPPIALAMAMNGCKPIPYSSFKMRCWWQGNIKMDFINKNSKVQAIHWGTRCTKTPYYGKQIKQIDNLLLGKTKFTIKLNNFYFDFKILFYNIKKKLYNAFDRIINSKFYKKLRHRE